MKAFCIPFICGPLLSYFEMEHPSLSSFSSLSLPLKDLYNNQAASVNGSTGNFDKHGGTYPAEYLPTGPWIYNGVTVGLMDLNSLDNCHPGRSMIYPLHGDKALTTSSLMVKSYP